MFTRLRLSQFKSIHNLDIELGKVNGFVGMNGSGKSTILQAFDFISQIIIGNFDQWLESREWDDLKDIQNKYVIGKKPGSKYIEGTLEYQLNEENSSGIFENVTILWEFKFDLEQYYCVYEKFEYQKSSSNPELIFLIEEKKIKFGEDFLFNNFMKNNRQIMDDIGDSRARKVILLAFQAFHEGVQKSEVNANSDSVTFKFNIPKDLNADEAIIFREFLDMLFKKSQPFFDQIDFDYQGSILSSYDLTKLPNEIRLFHNAILNISSLEQLSPSLLRKKSRISYNGVGIGGERLSGFLNASILKDKKIRDLFLQLVRKLNPNIDKVEAHGQQGGWQSISVSEKYDSNKVTISSKHLNDGLLRCIAMIAQSHFHKSSLILLDEIENGLNQEIINQIAEILIESNAQVIFTTHSPLMLNAFPDEYINNNVRFCYRAKNGVTKVEKLIDIVPEPEMLNFLGIGEVYLQTNLIELQEKRNSSVID